MKLFYIQVPKLQGDVVGEGQLLLKVLKIFLYYSFLYPAVSLSRCLNTYMRWRPDVMTVAAKCDFF